MKMYEKCKVETDLIQSCDLSRFTIYLQTHRINTLSEDSNRPCENHMNSNMSLKEGCLMKLNNIFNIIKFHRYAGLSINLGIIGLNFDWGSR